MTITALIAEDEALPRTDLVKLLHECWPELHIAAQCENGLEALDAIAALKPQVAFLDIRMPGANGLEVARAASGQCHVVFITAYDHYAIEAFNAGAVDYLLKPVQRERLAQTVARIKEHITTQPAPDLTALLSALNQQHKTQRLKWVSANMGDTIKMFGIDEVLYFQSEDKYTKVVTTSDEAHIRKTLRDLSDELDPDVFWQVHRSTIVRADAIARAQRDDLGKIQLSLKARPEKIAVSQAFAYRFKGM
jgi:DNA-binding LytR/AlgR family response regulator